MHFKISPEKKIFLKPYVIHSRKFYFPSLIIFSKDLSQNDKRTETDSIKQMKGTGNTSPRQALSWPGRRSVRVWRAGKRSLHCSQPEARGNSKGILDNPDTYLPIKNQIKWYFKATLMSKFYVYNTTPRNFWGSDQKRGQSVTDYRTSNARALMLSFRRFWTLTLMHGLRFEITRRVCLLVGWYKYKYLRPPDLQIRNSEERTLCK